MTMRRDAAILNTGLIESSPAGQGAHKQSTFDSTGDNTGREAPENERFCSGFVVSEGVPMIITKNIHRLFTATAVFDGFKAEGDGLLIGYASTFGGLADSHGDVIAPGAFAKSLAQHEAAGSMPALLWSHKQDEPIGKWTSMREDGHGLLAEGVINLRTSGGRDAWEHLKAGDANGLSIGYRLLAGGEEIQRDGTALLKEVDLYEVSVVVFPSNRAARVLALKSINSKSELVDLLREAGLARSAAQKIAHGGYSALMGADQQKAIEFAAQIEAATAKIRSL
ncbi:HK97 family phage prohead protease [Agrobacterium vitis]|uniref:HK97 family phage prohead protease n=2 Tax=Agrobacterium vitis TaxID=373 RepID=A0AAE4WGB8_AGRVI|nr:HK97 family phage prohead protease [Allorhizobium sp. Av2]MCM2440564.1 HK97 family phage prohead protease [Agrobacterium vitis]MUZ59550.1 HK97 family phage prohead protease [Agrobacterium vitis]MVA66688.1 HK97 family phage prohead protease [Agrobacterium vitis]MVA87551.1 HK97 family phage prohead protease [Agrobacterium vitis]